MDMIRRCDLYMASLEPVIGSEQGGARPVLIVQNDAGNRCSPTVITVALTGALNKPTLPTHVFIRAGGENRLTKDSIVLTEQIRTLDKRRLRERMGCLNASSMRAVDDALRASLALDPERG